MNLQCAAVVSGSSSLLSGRGFGPRPADKKSYAEELQQQMKLNEEKKKQEKKVNLDESTAFRDNLLIIDTSS